MSYSTERRRATDHRPKRNVADAPRCLRCNYPVGDRPRGCKSAHCPNCGHPYPLGDCSD